MLKVTSDGLGTSAAVLVNGAETRRLLLETITISLEGKAVLLVTGDGSFSQLSSESESSEPESLELSESESSGSLESELESFESSDPLSPGGRTGV